MCAGLVGGDMHVCGHVSDMRAWRSVHAQLNVCVCMYV